jgi:uncharacterized Zn-finger protein
VSKLLPSDRSIDLKYECPSCEDHPEMWLTEKEASVKGFKTVCPLCNTVYEIEPIRIIVKARKLNVSPKVSRSNHPRLQALLGLYKKEQINKAVSDLNLTTFGDDEIKKLVLKIEENESIQTS